MLNRILGALEGGLRGLIYSLGICCAWFPPPSWDTTWLGGFPPVRVGASSLRGLLLGYIFALFPNDGEGVELGGECFYSLVYGIL